MLSAQGDVWETPCAGSPGDVILEKDPRVDPEPDRGVLFLIWSGMDGCLDGRHFPE